MTRYFLKIDRQYWKTLQDCKEVCNKLYLENLFTDTSLSDKALEAVLNIEEAQAGLLSEHTESPENIEVFKWAKN